jgi:hypothetical protein
MVFLYYPIFTRNTSFNGNTLTLQEGIVNLSFVEHGEEDTIRDQQVSYGSINEEVRAETGEGLSYRVRAPVSSLQ